MKQSNFKSAQTHYEFVLGPIKIKDGLFMGDQLAAKVIQNLSKDIQFIISNKVTHVINTVSKVIPNLWERFGIQYLSVNWTEKQQNIFDKKNNAINAIFDFVQQAMEQGQSCLIHSLHGKSRACAVMVAYMMKKYHWNLDRCFQYITSKKEHLEIRDNYLSQLQQLQKRMAQIHPLSGNWNQVKSEEEIILKNTYFNSKAIEFGLKQQPKSNKRRIEWGEVSVIPNKATSTTTAVSMSATMNRFRESKQKKPHETKRLKSILKGQQNPGQQEDDNEMQQKMIATDSFPSKKDNNFISTINGNIVHVTVNNFITTDKKPDRPMDKSHLTRPYSSDNKERLQKQARLQQQKFQPKKNLFTYDTSFKSPYDTKLASKIGSNNKLGKKKEEIKNPIMTYERPQSANIAAQRRKMKNIGIGFVDKKEEMIITGKKRYPSTNPREELYRFK